MGLQVEAGAGKAPAEQREIAKKGPRVAIISGIIDIGMQPQEYKGEKQRDCREFLPIFTLVSDKYTDEDGDKHCMVTSPFPVRIKLGEKSNYTKFCNAADPNGEVVPDGVGDLSQLIGRGVFANMVHNKGKGDNADITYANCKGISELPEDYPLGEVDINAVVFDCNNPDKEVFDKLWDRTQDLITSSVGYEGSELQAVLEGKAGVPDADQGDPEDDDIPF